MPGFNVADTLFRRHRRVNLLGVDSANCPSDTRRSVWERLAVDWKPERLTEMVTEVTLTEVEEKIQAILKGEVRGRVVVKP